MRSITRLLLFLLLANTSAVAEQDSSPQLGLDVLNPVIDQQLTKCHFTQDVADTSLKPFNELSVRAVKSFANPIIEKSPEFQGRIGVGPNTNRILDALSKHKKSHPRPYVITWPPECNGRILHRMEHVKLAGAFQIETNEPVIPVQSRIEVQSANDAH